MAYTLVPTELIVDGAITSAKLDTNIAISGTLGVTGEVTLATHLIMGDNDKIKIGTGGDLEIYHDGSNSYISNSTGNIYLGDTNGSVHIQAKLNEESIICAADGAVTLYHDNSPKLATSSAGVTVTGTLAATLSTAAQPNITSLGTLTALTGGTGDLNWDSGTLFVDSSANAVGIGTTSPAGSGLHIRKDTSATTNELLRLSNSAGSTTDGVKIVMEVANTSGNGGEIGVVRDGGSFNPYMFFSTSSGVGSSPTEAMRIGSNNKIGVATTSTDHQLTVNASAFDGIQLQSGGSDCGYLGVNTDTVYVGAGSNLIFHTGNAGLTNGTERMRIDSSGNVGIGETSPSAPLTVNTGSDGNNVYIDNNGTQLAIGSTSSVNYINSQNGSAALAIQTNGSERMRIDSVGEVSIKRAGSGGSGVLKALNLNHAGTSVNDGAKISFTAGTSSEGAGIASTGQAFNSADLRFYAGGTTERWRIDSSGRMTNGFDGSSYGSFLQVAGNSISGGVVNFIDPDVSVATSNHILRCTFSVDTDSQGKFIAFYDGGGNIGSVSQNGASSVLFNTTSDERLKENIVDASSQLDVIKNVKVREFDWKSSSKHDIGMIAQELKDVIPNVVIEGGDDVTEEPFGVDYGKLTPYLIKAIQEQQVIIEDLKSRIETLENE